jgi:ABC-2 type transport system ATP-binding protein
LTTGVAVALEDVSRRFGRTEVLHGVSFEAHPGEVLGLLGPNGAGKTTTMRVLTGFLRPSAGRVRVGGVDAASDPVAVRRLIGYVPESAPVPRELTAREFLSYCARLRRVPRGRRRPAVGAALKQSGLERVADQVIGTLSRGYRQRVALAQALVHDPPVLVLDEPTASLDPRQVAETRALIEKLGRHRTVLLSSHLLSEVSLLCQRVVIIDRGRVVATRRVAELRTAGDQIRLEVRVKGELARAAQVLEPVEGVRSAVARGDRVVVHGAGAELAERVSAAVMAAGLGLVELRTSGEDLEDAYLRLVRD